MKIRTPEFRLAGVVANGTTDRTKKLCWEGNSFPTNWSVDKKIGDVTYFSQPRRHLLHFAAGAANAMSITTPTYMQHE
jgi:hypothetical protein